MLPTDIPSIVVALRLCAAAYADNVPLTFQKEFPGYQLIFNGIETSDANYALIAIAPDGAYYLSIRGSLPITDPPDWGEFYNWVIEDLNVYTQESWGPPSSGAVVSEGASIAFNQLVNMQNNRPDYSTIFPILHDAVHQHKTVYITGHSLGGNMANTFASYFAYQLAQEAYLLQHVYLYTFAAPGSGNTAFANSVDSAYPGDHSRHYELYNDIIPKFPVFANVLDIALKFLPHPAPFAPDISYDDVTLSDIFIAIAGSIALSYGGSEADAYVQVTNNYEIINVLLDPKYMNQDSIIDFLQQVKYQHGLAQYSKGIEGGPVLDDLKALATKYKTAFG